MNHGTPFNETATGYLSIVDQLIARLRRPTYTFMDLEEFQELARTDPARANQVYWSEMLGRVHLTSATALKRSRRWLTGIEVAVASKNLLAFAATMRGLIESAADATAGLKAAPQTLADQHYRISRALQGKLSKKALLCGELEDQLIHYHYARKVTKGESAPGSHHAKQVRTYLKVLEDCEIEGLVETYSWLCDLTHPGASSVWMWLDAKSEGELVLSEEQDSKVIASFLQTRAALCLDLVMFALNPPALALAVLNYFPLSGLHTPELASWDFSGIPAWPKIRRKLVGVSILGRNPA